MPLLRYFLIVGGVLLALLFISDAYLPKLPAVERVDTDLPVIRIHSERKWPERVVFDTSRPIIAAAPTAAAVPAAVAELSAKARVREAFAQLLPPEAQRQPPDQKQAQSAAPAKPDPKLHKRKIAKRRPAPAAPGPPVMLVAQQPQFGFFGNNTW
jgi:hypothetical protein